MSMFSVKFAYGLEERVTVRAIGMPGVVDSLSLDSRGPMFRVVYWNDGERHSEWMYEWEIGAVGGQEEAKQ